MSEPFVQPELDDNLTRKVPKKEAVFAAPGSAFGVFQLPNDRWGCFELRINEKGQVTNVTQHLHLELEEEFARDNMRRVLATQKVRL